ncbi:sodium:proton antiporter [Microbacterium sp. MPKO10]|uniref:cation:proton antiporter n=1 Tax=Microbacterium sp. MPKO10 TaxID=2989818 RepID=UPI00223625FF|nr:cation:proton antiporter [Microbacterium sp. MPKO10]MCW4457857.1 cation:proton antiporter [Microbacterium sp. MPKO10]
METILIIAVLGLIVIAAVTTFASRLGVAAPLLLVVLGIGITLFPAVPAIEIDPEWILAGVLPPLLYSASVSMPSVDFRREFTAIGGLSVALVVVSSILLGLFFWWVIPDISLAWGIALGAVVSPTDAVATSIVKGLGVSPRIVTMLEGESLLNDATALVMLRTAIAGAAAAVSFWGVLGDFVYAILVATAIGAVVGWLNLAVRSRITDATVGTVISFAVPFIASIPAEMLGASGLVAAVVAGLVTGRGALKRLTPWHRLTEQQNWRTIELLLESAVFLLLGLELMGIVKDVIASHDGVLPAVLVALAALVLTVVVRSGYVSLLVNSLQRRARRHERMRKRITIIKKRFDERDAFLSGAPLPEDSPLRGLSAGPFGGSAPGHNEESTGEGTAGEGSAGEGAAGEGTAGEGAPNDTGPFLAGSAPQDAVSPIGPFSPGQRPPFPAAAGRPPFPGREGQPFLGREGQPFPRPTMGARAVQRIERLRARITRMVADVNYFLERPFGWREGTVVVWAGMRGAVTVAAAQTFPADTPHRSTLVLIAFLVAAVSLLLQGGTLKWVISRVKPRPEPAGALADERRRLATMLEETAEAKRAAAAADGGEADEMMIITAQRDALLRVRDDGTFSTDTLSRALDVLDAEQISVELRHGQ